MDFIFFVYGVPQECQLHKGGDFSLLLMAVSWFLELTRGSVNTELISANTKYSTWHTGSPRYLLLLSFFSHVVCQATPCGNLCCAQAAEPELRQAELPNSGAKTRGGQSYTTKAVFSDDRCNLLGHVTSGKPFPSSSLASVSLCELVQGPARPFKGSLSSARALGSLVTRD